MEKFQEVLDECGLFDLGFSGNKFTGKVGHMALKLDMSKAYDKLEWIFLQWIMEKMGFHPTWVGWIMECIKSVSYSILVNGEPK